MKHNDNPFQHHYLQQLQVNLLIAEYTKVERTWKESTTINTFNKFYLIEDGEGVIYINQIAYYLKQGDWVFVPSGSEIAFSTISSKTYVKEWCHFTANIGLSPLTDYFILPIISSSFDYSHVQKLFKRLTAAYKNTAPYAPILYQSCLL